MTRRLLHLLLALGLLGGGAWSAPALALTTCTATATSVAFGGVSGSSTTDAIGSFSVTCNTFGLSLLARARVRMCLSVGAGSTGGGQYAPRVMTNALGDPLSYQLYSNSSRTTIWGGLNNASAPTPLGLDFDYDVPLLGGTQTLQVALYGRVPSGQALSVGNYASSFSGNDALMTFQYNEALLGIPAMPTSCTSSGTAGSASFPFTVSASVAAQCATYATTDLDFGSIAGQVQAARDGTSSLSMTCVNRTAWNIGLDNGINSLAGVRRMHQAATGTYINYELYLDSTRSQRWGTTVGVDTLPGTGTGSSQTTTIYGRVPAPQNPAAGNYSDTVTVFITY